MICTLGDVSGETSAILYQALPPPSIDGLRKDAKPGGYSDSGADIAWALRQIGVRVVTPVREPSPSRALDWVFPDTQAGIVEAIDTGATLLWANTVLFEGHPLEEVADKVWIVGQDAAATQAGDDKFETNRLLAARGLPVARSVLTGRLDAATLAAIDLPRPLVIKPVRGRGSQGVSVAASDADILRDVAALIDGARFGDQVMLEEYLPGTEMTVTVLPLEGALVALPPVRRFDQHDGVAPYNGDVAVSLNSRITTTEEQADPAIRAMLRDCEAAGRILSIRAPIRIDCRQAPDGGYRLFDLNMKPNITGAGRPGRDAEDSLSTIAAAGFGWSYQDLLTAVVKGAWRISRSDNP